MQQDSSHHYNFPQYFTLTDHNVGEYTDPTIFLMAKVRLEGYSVAATVECKVELGSITLPY